MRPCHQVLGHHETEAVGVPAQRSQMAHAPSVFRFICMNMTPDFGGLSWGEFCVLKRPPGPIDVAGFSSPPHPMLSRTPRRKLIQMKVAPASPSFASKAWPSPISIQAVSIVVKHGFKTAWPSAYKMPT